MDEPKFVIGQLVYIMPVANRTVQIVDRFWDGELKPMPSYRYKVLGSPVWFPESQLKTQEEMQEFLEAEDDPDDPDNHKYPDYDGDTGRAFINGRWVVVTPSQWERFHRS